MRDIWYTNKQLNHMALQNKAQRSPSPIQWKHRTSALTFPFVKHIICNHIWHTSHPLRWKLFAKLPNSVHQCLQSSTTTRPHLSPSGTIFTETLTHDDDYTFRFLTSSKLAAAKPTSVDNNNDVFIFYSEFTLLQLGWQRVEMYWLLADDQMELATEVDGWSVW
jgi:hypothetical protein